MSNLKFEDYIALLQLIDRHVKFLEKDSEKNVRSIQHFERLKANVVHCMASVTPILPKE
jgi:hypothetical protein